MPPRKKVDVVSTVAAPETTPATKPKTAKTKTKAKPKTASKRARAQSDNEEDAPVGKKAKAVDAADNEDDAPVGKKAKAGDVANDDDDDQDATVVDDKPAKMVTVLKRGAAPVDPHSSYVGTHQVYSTSEDVWDAMLNQTNVGQNNNKYYVLQLLHPIGHPDQCILLTRWGRVAFTQGEKGSSLIKGPWPPVIAISEFKKQFRAKTAHDWTQRVGMVAKKGKYTWLERSFEDEEEEEDDQKKSGKSGKQKDDTPIQESTLSPELQVLCELIFSISLIDAHLSSMNYDAKKLPLGKLAKSTISKGFTALKALSEVIANPTSPEVAQYGSLRVACQELSSAYYSIIPHDFGRSVPTVIDTMVILKKELELVDALGDMEVAQKLIQSSIKTDDAGNALNPIDAHFRSLGLSSMEPVSRSSSEFTALEAYARDTHGQTHRHYTVFIKHAFRVERQTETDAWHQAGFHNLDNGDRLLLWHGSRTTNFAGILKQGLRIAPPEAPSTGYMFGKGVYFADMMSKSANYCHAYLSHNTGLLLLCEVAAKPFFEQPTANYNADQDCKTHNKLCTKGLGTTQPAKWKDAGVALENAALSGCHMPDGPGEHVPLQMGYLQYNEYIVYDSSQIRLRYLLMVNMN